MIHNRLATLRVEANMSRKELADKVDVNYQTIGFIERGDYGPSLELAFRLARVFGVSITTIFSDEPLEPLFENKPKENA